MKTSASLFYQIEEFLVNLKETDQIKTLVEELKGYQTQAQEVQAEIETRVDEIVLQREITTTHSETIIQTILNSADDEIVFKEETKDYNELLDAVYKIEKKRKRLEADDE